ncbi:MAG: mannose-1-phosphate guanylyltransferase [Alphaproteobacteria bacterium]|nr:MAG: mannose-1-phosphate guanylyltransferase [Alphaproteobacteria bacterium]
MSVSAGYAFYGLIMAGGKGTRFWPESTAAKPKQYLNLISSKSLLEETLDRFDSFINSDRRFVVTVREQQALCEQSSTGKIAKDGIIFEPSGRNTGPCILMSIASLLSKGVSLDDVIAIVPSDHVILNKTGFHATLKKAADFSVKKQNIVTIGITPNFPHTGFGYIEKGELVDGEAFRVNRFKEKPHFELAKEYIRSGDYLWNAGMFVAPIKVLLEEFKLHAPKMYEHFEELKSSINNPEELKIAYEKMPADSIDYAVMEKSKKVSVVPATFDWNDMGSWDALSSVIEETHGNTLVKSDGAFFLNSADNVVFAPNKFVALINMDKHIVVSNDKVVLVAPVADAQDIKKVVEHLKINRPDLI